MRIPYYKRNTSDLRYHAYYFAAIESVSPLIITLSATDYSLFIIHWITSIIYSLLMLFFILILSSLYGNNLSVKLKIFLMKNVVYMILASLFYHEEFTVSSNPELILLGFYFNSFYVIYINIQNNGENNGEVTEEEINDPDDSTRSTVASNPRNETDRRDRRDRRDSLPSYEESFNYPNLPV